MFIVEFPDREDVIGPFDTLDAADSYLRDWPESFVEDAVIRTVRPAKTYRPPEKWELDPRVP